MFALANVMSSVSSSSDSWARLLGASNSTLDTYLETRHHHNEANDCQMSPIQGSLINSVFNCWRNAGLL